MLCLKRRLKQSCQVAENSIWKSYGKLWKFEKNMEKLWKFEKNMEKLWNFEKIGKKYGNLKKECGKHGKCTESIKICHKIILFSKETCFLYS